MHSYRCSITGTVCLSNKPPHAEALNNYVYMILRLITSRNQSIFRTLLSVFSSKLQVRWSMVNMYQGNYMMTNIIACYGKVNYKILSQTCLWTSRLIVSAHCCCCVGLSSRCEHRHLHWILLQKQVIGSVHCAIADLDTICRIVPADGSTVCIDSRNGIFLSIIDCLPSCVNFCQLVLSWGLVWHGVYTCCWAIRLVAWDVGLCIAPLSTSFTSRIMSLTHQRGVRCTAIAGGSTSVIVCERIGGIDCWHDGIVYWCGVWTDCARVFIFSL